METLLNPLVEPIEYLRYHRIRLDDTVRTDEFETQGHEWVVYPLLGSVDVVIDETFIGSLGLPRKQILDIPRHYLLRIPHQEGANSFVKLNLATTSPADLIVACRHKDSFIVNLSAEHGTFSVDLTYPLSPSNFFIQTSPVRNQEVGKGTHKRLVREYETPSGYSLHVGETINVRGGWSSWPSHCRNAEQAETRCRDHEEAFFVVTPGKGYVHMDGWFCNKKRANKVVTVENGGAYAMPLGSHPIVFTPDAWGYYQWTYYSKVLTKTYNKWAEECGVKTYVQ